MKKILFLLLIVSSTMYGQKSWDIEGNYFIVLNKDTGKEITRIDNFKPVRGFSLEGTSVNLFSQSCKKTKCYSEVNTYKLGKEAFEYDKTTIIESKIEFGVCINGMKNVQEYGMAIDKKGNPIHTVSGNQASTKKEINCLYMTYFSARGDKIETKLAGYFDTTEDGVNIIQYKLLKRFFLEMEGFRLNSFELVDADLKIIKKISELNKKDSYIIHYAGTLENLQLSLTKITSVTKKNLKKRVRKRKTGNGLIELVIDCDICSGFKE